MDTLPFKPPLSAKVMAPASAQEVADILKQATADQLAVIPVGGRTMLHYGAPPTRADLLVSTEKLDRVIAYEPADLTVRAEAGLSLGALNAVLGEHGQCLPLDPPCPDRATLGGILATNASGALRVRFGTARDLLIGIRVALTNGQVIHGGGEVVKNVAGYDLPKLFIGSLGTLGIIVEASFKLAPVPPSTETVVAVFQDLDRAASLALQILRSRLAPLGLELANPLAAQSLGLSGGYALIARAGGVAGTIQRHLDDVARWASAKGAQVEIVSNDHALWASLRDFSAGHKTLARVSVLPADVPTIVTRAEELAREHSLDGSVLAHALGIVQIGLEGDPHAAVDALVTLRSLALKMRGHLVVERAPLEIQSHVDVWGPPRADWELMRRLKREFDPGGILNPGRFVGGL